MNATLFDIGAAVPNHPARYTTSLLPVMASMLRDGAAPAGGHRAHILDPFGGVGGIFQLGHWLPDAQIEAVEIEPEWAAAHPRLRQGNALHLPFDDHSFDAICTSPCYGNRMGDTVIDSWTRYTYTSQLGRKLHPDNSGKFQWGNRYRDFHVKAWTEAKRVLIPGGSLILNIKDHIRDDRQVYVTNWQISCLEILGFSVVDHVKVATPGMGFGQNGDKRVPYESVIHFVLEAT